MCLFVQILSDERRRSRYDYAIRNPDGWLDEDGNYNAEPGQMDYKIISICLILCCLFFAATAKWVSNQVTKSCSFVDLNMKLQEFWNPPQVQKKKKKNGKKQ